MTPYYIDYSTSGDTIAKAVQELLNLPGEVLQVKNITEILKYMNTGDAITIAERLIKAYKNVQACTIVSNEIIEPFTTRSQGNYFDGFTSVVGLEKIPLLERGVNSEYLSIAIINPKVDSIDLMHKYLYELKLQLLDDPEAYMPGIRNLLNQPNMKNTLERLGLRQILAIPKYLKKLETYPGTAGDPHALCMKHSNGIWEISKVTTERIFFDDAVICREII